MLPRFCQTESVSNDPTPVARDIRYITVDLSRARNTSKNMQQSIFHYMQKDKFVSAIDNTV